MDVEKMDSGLDTGAERLSELKESLDTGHYGEVLQADEGARVKLLVWGKSPLLDEEHQAMMQRAFAYPVKDVMALAIKESGLDPGENTMQLSKIAIDEINNHFPQLNASVAAAADPELQMAYGRLYLALLRTRYIERDSRFEEWPARDRVRLTHLMYNLGPVATKRFVDATGAKDMDSLLKGMERIASEKVGKAPRVELRDDPYYKVAVQESEAMRYYRENRNAEVLKQAALDGSKYPSVEKLLISLRYAKVTEAISAELAEDPGAYVRRMDLL